MITFPADFRWGVATSAYRDTIDRYADLATVIHDALRDRVRLWSTMNEVALMTCWYRAFIAQNRRQAADA